MAWALTILCLLFLGALLWAERSENRRLRYICKPAASLAFVGIGLVGYQAGQAYAGWILAGLFLGAAGDVALMFPSSRSFLLGLVSFLLGHIAYVVAFACLVPLSEWPGALAIVPVVAAIAVLGYLWPHLGSMRGPVIAYVAAIVLMVVGALAVYQARPTSLDEPSARLVLVGALLFFASDVSVAKGRFVKARFADKLWGLPAYYLGQLCIAWSLFGS